MKKNNNRIKEMWKQNLTNKKFWTAVTAFVSAMLILVGVSDIKIEQIVAAVGAFGILVAYIVGGGIREEDSEGNQEGDEDREQQ